MVSLHRGSSLLALNPFDLNMECLASAVLYSIKLYSAKVQIFSVLTCELNHRYEWVVEICVQVVCAKSTERPKIRTCFQSSPALVSCNAPRIGIETRTSGDVGTFRHMIIVACVP